MKMKKLSLAVAASMVMAMSAPIASSALTVTPAQGVQLQQLIEAGNVAGLVSFLRANPAVARSNPTLASFMQNPTIETLSSANFEAIATALDRAVGSQAQAGATSQASSIY